MTGDESPERRAALIRIVICRLTISKLLGDGGQFDDAMAQFVATARPGDPSALISLLAADYAEIVSLHVDNPLKAMRELLARELADLEGML